MRVNGWCWLIVEFVVVVNEYVDVDADVDV
jgi:hypothetical protein